ncbi:hypothetical protein [Brevibacterium otitidis]|uniref:Uncharacterized protein n=1 Tax=Brevibacterium otitidis TaxID=53364 RepID=A0ABV5X181_9MICO
MSPLMRVVDAAEAVAVGGERTSRRQWREADHGTPAAWVLAGGRSGGQS